MHLNYPVQAKSVCTKWSAGALGKPTLRTQRDAEEGTSTRGQKRKRSDGSTPSSIVGPTKKGRDTGPTLSYKLVLTDVSIAIRPDKHPDAVFSTEQGDLIRGILLRAISKPTRIMTWISGPVEEPNKVMKWLAVQNPGLNISTWNVVGRKQNPKGQQLTNSDGWGLLKENTEGKM